MDGKKKTLCRNWWTCVSFRGDILCRNVCTNVLGCKYNNIAPNTSTTTFTSGQFSFFASWMRHIRCAHSVQWVCDKIACATKQPLVFSLSISLFSFQHSHFFHLSLSLSLDGSSFQLSVRVCEQTHTPLYDALCFESVTSCKA